MKSSKDMLSEPPNPGTKVGATLYGLGVGLATLTGIVFVSFLVGALIAWLFDSNGWTGLEEYKPWLPIMLGEYSIVPGIAIGAVVGWKLWKARVLARQ
jgi:hypothetical protein